MKPTHAPNQARNSLSAIQATTAPGAARELHRSLDWRVISLEGGNRPDRRVWFSHLLDVRDAETVQQKSGTAGRARGGKA